jgi:hypothetical protein
MADPGNLELTSEAFSKRLANLLIGTRVRDGRSVGAVSRASLGVFSRHDLREFESATRILDDATVEQLAALYGCDLAAILPARLPVVIAPSHISMGGVVAPLESDSHTALLTAYLTLVRTLRRQYSAPTVALRRDDIDVLSAHLGEEPSTVVERLLSLMNATQSKRAAVIGLLATGAAVIGLVGTAAAITTTGDGTEIPHPTTVSSTTVVDSPSTTGGPVTSVVVTTVPASTSPSSSAVVTTAPSSTVAPTTVATPTTTHVYVPPTTTQPATTTTVKDVSVNVPLPTTTTIAVDVGGGFPPIPTTAPPTT